MTRDADQERAIDLLRRSLASGHRRPVLQAPTGYGKTSLASKLTRYALDKGKRVTFCVPALSLVDQTVTMFWNQGIQDVGVIQAQHAMTDWGKPVQVASVQTLMKRGLPDCDVILIDECHRFFEIYARWMQDPAWAEVPIIGLSATPWTKGLGNYFDDLVVAGTIPDGIEKGYLSPFRVFAPGHVDLQGVRTVGDDYNKADISKKMDTPELVADVVSTWIRLAEDRPTFVFAVDRGHAKHLEQRFTEAGIAAAYQDAETTPVDRGAIRRGFHDGSIKVVCSVGTLTTGVDWDVRCISLARPTKSAILFVQMIGRGLRVAEGKTDCLILDHSDSHQRLGFVTDIGADKLCDGKMRRTAAAPKAALPRECPQCAYLKMPGERACRNCGHEVQTYIAPREVEFADGQLEELTKQGGTCKVSSRVIQLRGRQIPLTVFWGALVTYAQDHKFKVGWCYHKYREAVGVEPNGVSRSPACMIPDEVESWLRSRQIAWAKSKRRRAPQALAAD